MFNNRNFAKIVSIVSLSGAIISLGIFFVSYLRMGHNGFNEETTNRFIFEIILIAIFFVLLSMVWDINKKHQFLVGKIVSFSAIFINWSIILLLGFTLANYINQDYGSGGILDLSVIIKIFTTGIFFVGLMAGITVHFFIKPTKK